MSIDAFAKEVGVNSWTIRRFENNQGGLKADTQDKIMKVLERRGIYPVDETDDTEAGIVIRKRKNTCQ